MRTLIPIVATAALAIASAATSVLAQSYPPAPGSVYLPPATRPLPRVDITPRVRVQYYRDCVDGYVVEPRLTGPTVVPRMRCHWAKRYYAY
jgi:hypothetical protein